MKRTLALVAVLAFTGGCETQADRDKLKNAQLVRIPTMWMVDSSAM